jgi:hypothetical protein
MQTDALGELLTVDRVPVDAHSLELGFELSTVRQRVWGSRRERVRAQVLIPEIGWRERQEHFAGCACMSVAQRPHPEVTHAHGMPAGEAGENGHLAA